MFRLVGLLIGYLIGCISTAFIMMKIMKVDLRQHGSGNLGTTNALRVLGLKAGLTTLAGDILKCVLAFFILINMFPEEGILAGIYAALGTIVGHNFPFYLNFKGGKGIASSLGLLVSLGIFFSPWMAIIPAGIGLSVVAKTKYISAGSITGAILLPLTALVLHMPMEEFLIILFLGALAVYRHKENIQRLRTGTENKLSVHKKEK